MEEYQENQILPDRSETLDSASCLDSASPLDSASIHTFSSQSLENLPSENESKLRSLRCLKASNNGEPDICNNQVTCLDQEVSGKRVGSRISEITQRVKALQRVAHKEFIRKEQHHLNFISQCQLICDLTISLEDYNEICNKESLPIGTVNMGASYNDNLIDELEPEHEITYSCNTDVPLSKSSISDNPCPQLNRPPVSSCCFQNNITDTSDQLPKQNENLDSASYNDSLIDESEHEITYCNLDPMLSKSSISDIPCPQLNRPSVSSFCFESNITDTSDQVLKQNEILDSCNETLNQSEDLNSHAQISMQNVDLVEEHTSVLERFFQIPIHKIAVIIRIISFPFIISIFTKR